MTTELSAFKENEVGQVDGNVNHQIEEIQQQLEELQKNNNPRNMVVIYLLEETESPFNDEIEMATMPKRFKLLDTKYDGICDPKKHLETYNS